MRKLTWAAIGFGCAAFLAEYFLPVQGLPYIAAALVVFLGLSFLLKGKARYRALICLGAAVAGHHGSAGASGILFLQAVKAETAIVSVGRNSYGLPAEEALERLNAYCPVLLRTDEAGNITIEEKAEDISYGESREESLQLR